jgi:uncharacterized repeat protein (TIGR01451 family)
MKRIHLKDALLKQLKSARWWRMAAMGLLVCGSSCSSASQYVKNVFQKEPALAQSEDKDGKSAGVEAAHTSKTHKKSGDSSSESLNRDDDQALAKSSKTEKSQESEALATRPGTKGAATGPAKGSRAKEIPAVASNSEAATSQKPDVLKMISKGEDPFAGSDIQQASIEIPEVAKAAQNDAIKHSAEPRTPVASTAGQKAFASAPCPPGSSQSARPFPTAEFAGDEYVCDGGDRKLPVHYEGTNRAGLDVEDTVAEFKDETGKMHVKATNEACVYAPRFGEVRTATLPQEGLAINRAAGHQDKTAVVDVDARTVLDEKVQRDEPWGMDTRARASGLEKRDVDVQMHQAKAAETHVSLLNAYEDFRFIREGQFDRANPAIIALGVTASQEWADGRRPIIVAKDDAGQIVQGRFTAQDYTGVEDRRTPGELKLLKVADKESAHPGDVVTFTIRFDNVGGRELQAIRIVDNLSPRLEYIEGSVSCNLDGRVDVEENGFGGKLLTFEFDKALPGKTGGYVSFQCRVR